MSTYLNMLRDNKLGLLKVVESPEGATTRAVMSLLGNIATQGIPVLRDQIRELIASDAADTVAFALQLALGIATATLKERAEEKRLFDASSKQ